jgi:hypothetical protein
LIGGLLLAFRPTLTGAANEAFAMILAIAGWVVIALTVIFFVLSLVSYLLACKKTKDAAPIEVSAEESAD